MASVKRQHTPPAGDDSSSSPEPTAKALRTQPGVKSRTLICTLPPTCHPPQNKPIKLANSAELERHYATYHAHVCEQPHCGCVFPDERLLELHFTECHDPVAAVRKDRGEKIFACHVSTCTRLFSTPKTRRLHLISAHGYPKQYFFAVTNKGVGGLLKRWGEGVSMVRGDWKVREATSAADRGPLVEESSDEDEEVAHADADVDEDDHMDEDAPPVSTSESEADDGLARQMDALSLVPNAIRFGRAGNRGGFKRRGFFEPRGRGRGAGRGRGGHVGSSERGLGVDAPTGGMGVSDFLPRGGPPRGRAGIIHVPPGRGSRGRGRGM